MNSLLAETQSASMVRKCSPNFQPEKARKENEREREREKKKNQMPALENFQEVLGIK